MKKKYPRRKRIAPKPAKPCQVFFTKHFELEREGIIKAIPLCYDKAMKILVYNQNEMNFSFPSRRRARSAIWHMLDYFKTLSISTPETQSREFHVDDFIIVEISN